MNTDVLPDSNGFLVVSINSGGYIYSCGISKRMVHRESRNMQEWGSCWPTLGEAKLLVTGDDQFVLELDNKGAGRICWLYEDTIERLSPRFDFWKGCYGKWPIRPMNRKETESEG